MKKLISVLIIMTLVFVFYSCGKKDKYNDDDTGNINEQVGTNKLEQTDKTEDTDKIEETTGSGEVDTPEETNVLDETDKPETTQKTEETKMPPHTHTYSAATCTQPKKCSCGATEGGALGHKWINATCITPKTCSVCKFIEGGALGHSWTSATCTSSKTCTLCKKTEGGVLEHSWTEATCQAPKTCYACKVTEGTVKEHLFQNGKCSYCKKEDVINVAENFSTGANYVGYNVHNTELSVVTLTYKSGNIFSMTVGSYTSQYDGDPREPIVYNGITYSFFGYGGFEPEYVIKDNTIIFSSPYLFSAVYVMQHDKKLRRISFEEWDILPEILTIA